ncbi:hypothetical protein [Agrobacterium genomosp. 13]|uniref:Replication protein n=1 Tax=Agrobacterium genomosp. 13 str. CFBP 6927 TaxID=1183428 RepID=A0ABP2BF22_9HYPH|nr:hypothetical protein [Agrobacterium genomosp. 13]CUX24128.1 conserved hypothetical protein [Agrobacterium genomosp. 13 str. CFBP 6927]
MYRIEGKYGRAPIRSLKALEVSQLDLDGRIKRYLVSRKPDISNDVCKALELRASRDLNAANLFSRIQVATCLERDLKIHFAENGTHSVFFVTLISELHAVKVREQNGYDLVAHRKWIASLLKGCDYVGVIEPAYYPEAAFVAPREDWISWHAHVIVWNNGAPAMKKLKDTVNQIEVAFRPDGSAFHYRKAQHAEIEAEVAYMFKSPRSEYRTYNASPVAEDSQAPARSRQTTISGIKQNKREIRTGKLLAVLSALSDKSIKSITVAGGAGKAIRKHSLKAARQALVDEHAKRKRLLLNL